MLFDDRMKKQLADIELCKCGINIKGRWVIEDDGGRPVRVYRCMRCKKRIYAKVE